MVNIRYNATTNKYYKFSVHGEFPDAIPFCNDDDDYYDPFGFCYYITPPLILLFKPKQ